MALKILSGLLIVMFPVGLVIMLSVFGQQYLWTTSIFLGLQAVILSLFLLKISRAVQAILPSVIILILSFLVEYIGVNTGYPFGNYIYTNILVPQLLGVPIAIAFAWFNVAVSAYLITINLFGKAGSFTIALISSALIFSTDILLEPFASFINGFWFWDGGKIPFQNFLSWLVLGFIFSLLLTVFIKPFKDPQPVPMKIPYIIFGANILTFLIVNIYNNYIFMNVVGATIIAFIIFILPVIAKNET